MNIIPKLAADQFITVFMSTSVNDVRLHDDPPLLPVQYEDSFVQGKIEDGVNLDARLWDNYRDIVQLSFLHRGCFKHFMLCQDTAAADMPDSQSIGLYDDEHGMLVAAFSYLFDMLGPENSNGMHMYNKLLVGHRMQAEIWPILVNRAIKYRIPLHRSMITDPETRYSTIQHIADISSLYLQGGYPGRKAPSLPNLLKFWGFHKNHRPLPEDIADAICTDPAGMSRYIESYLQDMHDVLCCYYDTDQHNELDGVPVPSLFPLSGE